MYQAHLFPRVFIVADTVAFACDVSGRPEKVLLIKRTKDPFRNSWALPGGFFDLSDPSIVDAAARELFEETGVRVAVHDMRLIGVYSKMNRDPRECHSTEPCRIVSIAYAVKIAKDERLTASDDAQAANFFLINELPPLAFDHAEIIATALAWRFAQE